MRKFFIISLIAASLIALIVLLYPKSEQGAQFGQVKLPDNVKELLVGKWEWKATDDPFEGSNKRVAETEGEKFLIINKDGSFVEWAKEESREGVWILNKKKTAVAFIFNDEKNRSKRVAPSLLAYEYRHRIQKIDNGELVLGIQGRHGMVQESYQSISDEVWETLFPKSK